MKLPALVATEGGNVDGENLKALYEMIAALQEELNKKLLEYQKNISKLEKEIKKLKGGINSKADREAVIDGQQQFFDDLNTNEQKVDDRRNSMMMGEFKRLGDKITAEYTELDRRVSTLEKKAQSVVTKPMVDEKLDRVEFENAMANLHDNTLDQMQKQIDKAKKDIECIEVSHPRITGNFSLTTYSFATKQ